MSSSQLQKLNAEQHLLKKVNLDSNSMIAGSTV